MECIALLVNLLPSMHYLIAEGSCNTVSLSRTVSALKTDLDELKAIRDDLKVEVDKNEFQGLACTSHCKGWMKEVEAAEVRAELIIDKIGHRRQASACFNAKFYVKRKLCQKVLEILQEIDRLKQTTSNIRVTVDGGFVGERVVDLPSGPVVGLHMMLENIGQYLAEDGVSIIGICGVGGVGKTTLMKHINNDFLTKSHHYDVVIWVVVSKDLVPGKIQQAIGDRLGLSWEESESQDQRALKLYRTMKKKKFLLLLDDVWEGIDFEKIGIPLPDNDNKCNVIFTTRSVDVCSAMDAHQVLKVGFLSNTDSWELFSNKVRRKDILESLAIRRLAETIVRKCGGLPLALITIGRAMANKETEQEWLHAIDALNTSPTQLRGMEDVFTLLKFSYDNLESNLLRASFLYCAIFPDDYSIEKEQLIEYWIGEGFLVGSRRNNLYHEGHTIIGSLKMACLLETGAEKTQVKMHDVIRSFALWIATECGTNKQLTLVEPSVGMTEAPEAESWEGALVISLLDNEITALPEEPVCFYLSTLLLQWNRSLKRIPEGFFRHMPALRVLDVSFTSLTEIPASIAYSAELSHLNLSGTEISALPLEIGNLAKLKHLDLQRTPFLQRIPRACILGLTRLEILNMYYSYAAWELDCAEGEVRLADLESLKHLRTLGITILETSTLIKLLFEVNKLQSRIQYIYIEECKDFQYLKFPANSNYGKILRRLSVKNCPDLEYMEVSTGVGNDWLPSLEVLALHSLPNLTTVWKNPVRKECLKNLRFVNIWHCDKLKHVSWLLQLPKLEVFYLFYCKEIEEAVSSDGAEPGVGSIAFPSLAKFSIRGLPKLTSISPFVLCFPALESIAVMDCPNLKRLPLEAIAGSTLPTVYGNKDWWDGLEWDDSLVSTAYAPHFIAT